VLVFVLRCFGYGLAVLASVLVTLLLPVFPELVGWYDLKGLLALFIVGLPVTGIGALPAFMIAVYVQSSRDIRSPYYWIISGVAAALFANVLFAVVFMPMTNFIIFNSSLIGGGAGGFIYSLFHRKIIYLRMNFDVILKQ
jgi:ABC-type cobalamin transport system permease subunit